jgi:hypothetical protein
MAGWITGADGEGCSNWVVDGCESNGPIYIFGAHNTVKNCLVYGTSNNGPVGGDLGNGVKSLYPASHHNTITANNIHDFTTRGVWMMQYPHDDIVSNNTIYNAVCGIDFDGAGSLAWNETAVGNLIYDCTNRGIELEACFNSSVIGNEIKHCGSIGLMIINYATGYSGGPNGNDYTENFYVTTNILVQNNLIHHGTGSGFTNTKCSSVKLYGNTIADNALYGVVINGVLATNCEFVNNLMLNNGTSNPNNAEIAVGQATFVGTFAVEHHNLVWHPGNQSKAYGLIPSPFTQLNLAGYQAASGNGASNIQADPIVVDAALNNYHLQTTSPCKNAGDPTIGGTVDKDNVIRGAQVDFGCYEYI